MEELKEKPPILTQDEAQSYIDQHYAELMKETTLTEVYPARWHREAQRDADVIWFNDWLKQEGYVRLSDNQSLPVIHETGDYIEDLEALHKEYQNDGWRKVELG